MGLFYKHEWDEENKELTLYINPTEAFYEFAVEYADKEEARPLKKNLLAAAREYARRNMHATEVNSYRIKFQQFLVAVVKEKNKKREMEHENTEYGYYRVKPDDTLRDIAHLFGMKIPALLKINGLNGDTLFSGMELKIPVYTHTVVASDSLHKIAQRYDCSKEAIRRMSKLQTDCLCPGQMLIIPKNVE